MGEKVMRADEFFEAAEEQQVVGSRYFEMRYGKHVRQLTQEEAQQERLSTSNTRAGMGRCPICGKPIDARSSACRDHYAEVKRLKMEAARKEEADSV